MPPEEVTDIKEHHLVREGGVIVGAIFKDGYDRVIAGFREWDSRNKEHGRCWCVKCAYKGEVPTISDLRQQKHGDLSLSPIQREGKIQNMDGSVTEHGPSPLNEDATCENCGEKIIK